MEVRASPPLRGLSTSSSYLMWHAPTTTRLPTPWIFAIFNTSYPQRYVTFPDEWRDGMPITGDETPPAGLYTPVRGFGKIWREQPGVRSTLGWALGPERGDTIVLAVFENGTMIWLKHRNIVHVFINNASIASSTPRFQ